MFPIIQFTLSERGSTSCDGIESAPGVGGACPCFDYAT